MIILISTASYEETASIVDLGVDIIDVKNVGEGSLGAQFPWQTRRIVGLTKTHRIKTSAALGDLPFKPGTAALAAFGVAQIGANYIKAGLHGMDSYRQAYEMMDAICQAVRMVSDTAIVVAAGYADYRRFGGLSPDDLVRAAIDAQCDAVMVDTAVKDGATLFDNLSDGEIRGFVKSAQQAGMKVALAGSLKIEHRERLRELRPDIIGVRGGVCHGENRNATICPEKTRRFLDAFHSDKGASNPVHV